MVFSSSYKHMRLDLILNKAIIHFGNVIFTSTLQIFTGFTERKSTRRKGYNMSESKKNLRLHCTNNS